MFKKFFAFTLAEVLMVAGIAGVVGVLTIPNMTRSYQKKANIAKAKTVLAKLDTGMQKIDIYKTLIGKSGMPEYSPAILNALAEHLDFRLVCGSVANSICFTNSTITDTSTADKIDSTDLQHINSTDCAKGILNDGTEMALCYVYVKPYNIANATDYRGLIFIDVDGRNKGPTKRGEDIFSFVITGTGVSLRQNNIEVDVLSR